MIKMKGSKQYTSILSIAGSDPMSGAGLQADIKAAAAMGVYAMTVVTSVTSQNSCGMYGCHIVSLDMVEKQIRTIFDDIRPQAVKIGMTATPEIVKCIGDMLKEYSVKNIVLDPVAVSTVGGSLCTDTSHLFNSMRDNLFPLARLITPNRHEAELILGYNLDVKNIGPQTAALVAEVSNAEAVLFKGGDVETPDVVVDYLYIRGGQTTEFVSRRISTHNTHGSGCTLSTAIACGLAKGRNLYQAVADAEKFVQQAIIDGVNYSLGKGGYGPLNPLKL